MCVCSQLLTTTSHITIFIEELWGRAALSNQLSSPSGPSLLLSPDCFCMSQSLQDIRPIFTVLLHFLKLHLSFCCLSLHRTKWHQLFDVQDPCWMSAIIITDTNYRKLTLFPEFGFVILWGQINDFLKISQERNNFRIRAPFLRSQHEILVVLPIRTGFLEAVIHNGQGSHTTRESILMAIALPWALVSSFTQLLLQQCQRNLIGHHELINRDHLSWQTSPHINPFSHSPCVRLALAHRLRWALCVAVSSRRTLGYNGLHGVEF